MSDNTKTHATPWQETASGVKYSLSKTIEMSLQKTQWDGIWRLQITKASHPDSLCDTQFTAKNLDEAKEIAKNSAVGLLEDILRTEMTDYTSALNMLSNGFISPNKHGLKIATHITTKAAVKIDSKTYPAAKCRNLLYEFSEGLPVTASHPIAQHFIKPEWVGAKDIDRNIIYCEPRYEDAIKALIQEILDFEDYAKHTQTSRILHDICV